MRGVNAFFFSFVLFLFSCQRSSTPLCTKAYTGQWQFTTVYSTNSEAPHTTEQYTGRLEAVSTDSIHLYYAPHWDYPPVVDCATGVLEGPIYQGNHGSGHYTGTLDKTTLEVTMVRIGGFPPYDTVYQVVRGVRR